VPVVAAANNGYKLVAVDVSLLKDAPPCTFAVDTAVTKPLAFTVTTGMLVDEPNDPTLEFTVANVALVIAVPVLPDRVKSPPVTDIEPETAAVETAVIKPLSFTVITGTAVDEPKEPVLAFTVAKSLPKLMEG